MRKIREVLRLHFEHRSSQHEIARSICIGQATVGEYLHRSKAAGLSWPLNTELSDEDLERLLFPPRPWKNARPRSLPDWALVDRELSKKGVTMLLLWQEYRRSEPHGYGYSRYADLYRKWKGKSDLRMCQRHKAGEKLFVDFAGLQMQITDPGTGAVRSVPIFTSAMGSSQRIFTKAYEAQKSEHWLMGIDDSFSFYGALPEVLVPDNAKACVTSPDRYEPVINPSFHDFALYYGLAVVPARVRKPRDKAKVENAVQQVERWVLAPLRHQTFFSLEELNLAIQEKVAELDARIMKEYQASRRELFEQIDRPAMRDLPSSRYTFATWKKVKVGPDYHVEFEGHRYSVPYTLVGKQVDLRISEGTLEIFHSGNRIHSHIRCIRIRGFTTEPFHMPVRHKDYAEWTPERMEKWALEIGPATSEFVRRLLLGKLHPEQGFRTCMGVISLTKSFGKGRVEAACARANHFGATGYRNVKTILEKGLDGEQYLEERTLGISHQNVRGSIYFASEGACAN